MIAKTLFLAKIIHRIGIKILRDKNSLRESRAAYRDGTTGAPVTSRDNDRGSCYLQRQRPGLLLPPETTTRAPVTSRDKAWVCGKAAAMIVGSFQRYPPRSTRDHAQSARRPRCRLTRCEPGAHSALRYTHSALDYTPSRDELPGHGEISGISGAKSEGDHDRGSNAADIATNDPRS
jgi:hypothetical protein